MSPKQKYEVLRQVCKQFTQGKETYDYIDLGIIRLMAEISDKENTDNGIDEITEQGCVEQ